MTLKLSRFGYIVILHLRTIIQKSRIWYHSQEVHYISEIAMKDKHICMLHVSRFICSNQPTNKLKGTVSKTWSTVISFANWILHFLIYQTTPYTNYPRTLTKLNLRSTMVIHMYSKNDLIFSKLGVTFRNTEISINLQTACLIKSS